MPILYDQLVKNYGWRQPCFLEFRRKGTTKNAATEIVTALWHYSTVFWHYSPLNVALNGTKWHRPCCDTYGSIAAEKISQNARPEVGREKQRKGFGC